MESAIQACGAKVPTAPIKDLQVRRQADVGVVDVIQSAGFSLSIYRAPSIPHVPANPPKSLWVLAKRGLLIAWRSTHVRVVHGPYAPPRGTDPVDVCKGSSAQHVNAITDRVLPQNCYLFATCVAGSGMAKQCGCRSVNAMRIRFTNRAVLYR